MPLSADGIIEFGRFRLHRCERTLLADGLKLDLGARAIDVLLALIDAGGTMVSKDELLDRVWPDAIVEENNLHVQVCALRRAFGADRDLIRTVPRHGYRFTGHVMADDQISFGGACRFWANRAVCRQSADPSRRADRARDRFAAGR